MRKRVALELLGMAREVLGTEFPSEEALKKYLQEHPDADKSKHTVKKQETPKHYGGPIPKVDEVEPGQLDRVSIGDNVREKIFGPAKTKGGYSVDRGEIKKSDLKKMEQEIPGFKKYRQDAEQHAKEKGWKEPTWFRADNDVHFLDQSQRRVS